MDRVLINGFQIPVLPQLLYSKDGEEGNAVLFIEDPGKQFLICFQEGMKCLDLIVENNATHKYIHSEYKQKNRYLHQCRANLQVSPRKGRFKEKPKGMAYFHMEIQDESGNIHICPGQMSVSHKYSWDPGIELVLVNLLNGITIANH